MRTNTRRALQLATAVLAGAGALGVSTSAASAGPLSTTSARTTLSSSQIADLTAVAPVRDTVFKPPVWCCGNLGILLGYLDDVANPTDIADIADVADIAQGFGG
jgi:hypothetical protein